MPQSRTLRGRVRAIVSADHINVRQMHNPRISIEGILAVALLVGSVLIGRSMAISKTSPAWQCLIYFGIYVTSVLIQCIQYFLTDPHTWFGTFGGAVWLGMIPAILLHILPYFVAFLITRYMIRKMPNQSPDPALASSTPGAGHQSRHR